MRRDKWKGRDIVKRYYAFKDECRANGVKLFPRMEVRFYIPMPKSWSQKKRAEMCGKPHTQTPDTDNLVKALKDCCLDDDSGIWHEDASKVWAKSGYIEVVEITHPNKREIL